MISPCSGHPVEERHPRVGIGSHNFHGIVGSNEAVDEARKRNGDKEELRLRGGIGERHQSPVVSIGADQRQNGL